MRRLFCGRNIAKLETLGFGSSLQSSRTADPGEIALSYPASRCYTGGMTGMKFDNSFAREMDGFYASCTPESVPAPRWLQFNRALAQDLGLDVEACEGESGLAVFAGNRIPAGGEPLAQAYAGHQFGHFSPQLGDGRAHLLGELLDVHGNRRDLAWKGSGRTPFSRGGDGKASVGPVLREYLMGEAMHALGIPTTRVLSAVATGETIYRGQPLPGAILMRVASSHIRVGTFEFFSARGDNAKVQKLADYALRRHFPACLTDTHPYLAFLRAMMQRQVDLIAQWMRVGFVHGVMNTDNMAISGETIDFGPCAFMEMYHPETVYSSIDERGRYAFANQSKIAQWNLARLAETLLFVLDESSGRAKEVAADVLQDFERQFEARRLRVFQAKLGLHVQVDDVADAQLVEDYLFLLQRFKVDFTLGFRTLSDVLRGDDESLARLFAGTRRPLQAWLTRWRKRLDAQGGAPAAWADSMDRSNPRFIPRNRLVEEALRDASEGGDMARFEKLLSIVTVPYADQAVDERYGLPGSRLDNEGYQTFCGT